MFWGITIFLIWYSYSTYIIAGNNIGKWLEQYIVILVFVFVFFIGVVFMTYIAFRRPNKFIGKLVKKEKTDEGYNLMLFEVKDLMSIICFTKEDNPFIAGNNYVLTVRVINKVVKSIEEYNETQDNKTLSKYDRFINAPNSGPLIGLCLFGFGILSILIISIVGLFVYPKYSIFYFLLIISILYWFWKLYPIIKDRFK